MTSWASQSRNVMNQLNVKKKTRIGTATASATGSARGSVYDFGTISPITTCRIEITRNATTTDAAVATPPETPPTALSMHARDGGLAECAEGQRRERDAELHRGDEVRRVADDLAHRARAPAALADELVETRVPHRHERVLGRHEERVPEHAEDDQDELECGHGAHRATARPHADAGRPAGRRSASAYQGSGAAVTTPLPAPART